MKNFNHEIEMIPVEGTHHLPEGYFNMGDEHGDLPDWMGVQPVHKVKLSDFQIGKYPVTQSLWRAVAQAAPEFGLDENPSRFAGDDHPVEQVSWKDITRKFLPALQKLTGKNYRLPTEAEWEYAARGGKFCADGYKYAGSDRLKDIGWFGKNSGDMTRPVGLKLPNQLGIHDMSGNVWEWCEDVRDSGFYQKCAEQGVVENPCVAGGGESFRVIRGGGWNRDAHFCRAAYRDFNPPSTRWDNRDFRLALSLQSVG